MPQVNLCRECVELWCLQWIEVARAITSEHHLARWNCLNRETVRIKFNGHIVVTSEFAHRNQVLDEMR